MTRFLSDKYLDKYLFVIYLLISCLFVYKYTPLYSIHAAILYGVGITIGYILYRRFVGNKRHRYLNGILIILVLILALGLLFLLDPHNTTVDRWSALYNWSETLFSGKYPYSTYTHIEGNHPSPFPFWQFIHIPFYLLGDMGIAHIIMLLTLFFVLWKLNKQFNLSLFLLLLLLSPSYWWEVSVRSDLMNNMFVCILFITIFHYRFRTTKHLCIVGLSIGLLLCTRLFAVIPLAIYFIPWLISKNFSDQTKLAICFLAGFIFPFIPLMIWDWDMLFYFSKSPIALQTQQGSIVTALAGILFVTLFSFLWKTYKQYTSFIAIIMFVFILLTFSQFVYNKGFISTIYNDIFDISYFNIAIPFVLFGISHYHISYEKTNFRDK